MKPRLLDLFCGAGGAAVGYARAGFDVVGVDVKPQPHYPFPFVQADALDVFDETLLMARPSAFDVIHASPPCQDHSVLSVLHAKHGTGWMLDATVARLAASDALWVVENVEGARMPTTSYSIVLCGSSFGIGVRRHRRFASNVMLMALPCSHRSQPFPVGVSGHGAQGHEYRRARPVASQADRAAAMGIDWMNRDELAQAIPPAMTEFIGAQLLENLAARVPLPLNPKREDAT